MCMVEAQDKLWSWQGYVKYYALYFVNVCKSNHPFNPKRCILSQFGRWKNRYQWCMLVMSIMFDFNQGPADSKASGYCFWSWYANIGYYF